MSQFVRALLLLILALVVLTAAAPAVGRLISALVPFVLVVGVVIAVLQLVRYFTRS